MFGILIAVVLFSFGVYIFNSLVIDEAPVARQAILEWLQQPAAVRFIGKNDRTYISWLEYTGKIQIRYYDHEANKFSRTYTVDDLYPDYGIEAQDDHNAPSLLVLPDGRLLIFYVVHDSNNSFFMKTSINAEDVFSWTPRTPVNDSSDPTVYNYPQAKRLSNGNIVLFYRKGIHYLADEYFKISNDNGKTWGRPTKIIDFNNQGIYAFVYSKENQLHIAWNSTSPHISKKNVYYTFSHDGGITWKKRNGIQISLPITEKNADLVFDSKSEPAFVWDIVADSHYHPFIVFAHKSDPGHEFRFAQWNGSAWKTSFITGSSLLYDFGHFFSGGAAIDLINPFHIYLSKKRAKLEIEEWTSSDQGKTWHQTDSITKNSLVDNFRPQLVQDYHADLRLIWSSGTYEGLVNDQWTGFGKVNLQSEVTKFSIPAINLSIQAR